MTDLTAAQIEIGEQLNMDCPQNDCRLYQYFFNKFQTVKADLEKIENIVSKTTVRTIEDELGVMRRKIEDMYFDNYAVQLYKKEMGKKAV